MMHCSEHQRMDSVLHTDVATFGSDATEVIMCVSELIVPHVGQAADPCMLTL